MLFKLGVAAAKEGVDLDEDDAEVVVDVADAVEDSGKRDLPDERLCIWSWMIFCKLLATKNLVVSYITLNKR